MTTKPDEMSEDEKLAAEWEAAMEEADDGQGAGSVAASLAEMSPRRR